MEETDDDKDLLSFLSQMTELHDVNFYIKRDDSTGGLELGGNKVRKLEFLLADALGKGANSVITIGGEQSNHCRATAAAARMVGLEPHLILRSRKAEEGALGMVGNLLVDRLMQAGIYTCTPGEYGRIGSVALVRRLAHYLEESLEGRKIYSIPVGGSNGIGTWGYVEGVDELLKQWTTSVDGGSSASLDHIVMACGSGGTTAGIAVGVALAFAGQQPRLPTVHAVGVCDTPEYFYEYIEDILTQMGFILPPEYASTQDFLQNRLIVHQGKGLGYAINTPEELDFIQSFALSTGVILDPVYSGKAMFNFVQYLKENSSSFKGSNVLFWHTGGGLGLYDKIPAMQEYLESNSLCQRLDIYGDKGGIDISKEVE
jgi:D-cysteine desulfhydrase family pyridoxal phosphate-dependent enzyme